MIACHLLIQMYSMNLPYMKYDLDIVTVLYYYIDIYILYIYIFLYISLLINYENHESLSMEAIAKVLIPEPLLLPYDFSSLNNQKKLESSGKNMESSHPPAPPLFLQ